VDQLRETSPVVVHELAVLDIHATSSDILQKREGRLAATVAASRRWTSWTGGATSCGSADSQRCLTLAIERRPD